MKTARCGRLTLRPRTGPWFRSIRLKHWTNRLVSGHSKVNPSRFSAGSVVAPWYRIVYLGETPQVAMHEVGALLGDPNDPVANPRGSWVILKLDLVLDHVVDLSDASEQRIIATNPSELSGNWLNYFPGIAPTQELGHALYAVPSLEAFIYRSAPVPGGLCLGLFPDKLGPRSSVKFYNEIDRRDEKLT